MATTIFGNVNKDGNVTSGTGFTSAKSATGQYTITFTTAFTGMPSFIATLTSDTAKGDQNNNFINVNPGQQVTTVYTVDSNEKGEDSPFSFIAIG